MEKIIDISGQTVAEIELIYKPFVKLSVQPKISSSRDAYEIFRAKWNPNKIQFVEQLKVMLLTKANTIIGIIEISSGNAGSTIADPKLIIGSAIKANASAFIMAHNHPSGSIAPSSSDIKLTQKVKEASKFFDLSFFDHLIITNDRFFSMAEEGVM
ncbi:MAG: JAB domain-containing protein [Chitinophagaceae bacterium]|nr:JAB domain-containing protein [Chitinophagaceae bacterium]